MVSLKSRFGVKIAYTLLMIGILLLFLGGCSDNGALRDSLVRSAPKEEAIAHKFIEDVVNDRPESAEQYVLPELQTAKTLENLKKISSSARGQQLKNIELVNVYSVISLTPDKAPNGVTRQVALTYQLEYSTGWNVSKIIVIEKNGQTGVTNVSGQPIPTSLENLNRFSLLGRSPLHYLYLLLTICVPLFCLVSFVICIRSRVRLKWLWAVFILLGFAMFKLNWTTGETSMDPLSVQLLGGGFVRSSLYGPWIIGWSLPLGAALFLLLRNRLLVRKAPEAEPIGGS